MYQRAFQIAPEKLFVLHNYGSFLQYVRKDYQKAAEYFEKMVTSPNYSDCDYITMKNYANFLKTCLKDEKKAAVYFAKYQEDKNKFESKRNAVTPLRPNNEGKGTLLDTADMAYY